MKEEEKNLLLKYAAQVGTTTVSGLSISKNTKYGGILKLAGVRIGIIELLNPEVSPISGAVDLYKVDIFAKTDYVANSMYF